MRDRQGGYGIGGLPSSPNLLLEQQGFCRTAAHRATVQPAEEDDEESGGQEQYLAPFPRAWQGKRR